MSQSTIQVNLAPQDEVIIKTVKKSRWLFPFIPMGVKSMRNPNTIDGLDVIVLFSKPELALLKVVKDGINKDHTINIKRASKQEARAIASWIKKGLLFRLRRENYMVNPYFLTPPIDKHEDILETWNLL